MRKRFFLLSVPSGFPICEATGGLSTIGEILIIDSISSISYLEVADKLNVRSRRGLHEGIHIMTDFSHGGDDVTVNSGLRIGFLVQISETCYDFVRGNMDLRYRRNGVLNITDAVIERSHFVIEVLVQRILTYLAG